VPEQVRSGLIVYNVMERRLLLVTVSIMAGPDTASVADTTDPSRMCQSDASVLLLPLLLRRLRHLAAVKVGPIVPQIKVGLGLLIFSVSINRLRLSLIRIKPI